VHVVAGVLVDASDRVLLAQRPQAKHLAGGWEFPGGKIENGETRLEGLSRELAEEIGVTLHAAHPLIRVRHAYPGRDIDLDVWMVTQYSGEPHGLEGQPLRWCPRAELPQAQLIPADRPVVTALMLPEVITAVEGTFYLVEDRAGSEGRGERFLGRFCDGVDAARDAAANGADFLLIRARHSLEATAAICAFANVPVYARGHSLRDAWESGASGIHEISD
jgi:mutator protein MutT